MGTEQPSPTSSRTWKREEVHSLIREIISDLAPAPGPVVPEARLTEDLGCHSLSLLELAFSVEDEFQLPTIDEATARQILLVKDVENHVLAHLEATGQLSDG